LLLTVKRLAVMIIILLVGRFWFVGENENSLWFQGSKIWWFAECMTPYNCWFALLLDQK